MISIRFYVGYLYWTVFLQVESQLKRKPTVLRDNLPLPYSKTFIEFKPYGGEGGIRTHGTLARTPVFKTGPFNHSGTSPAAPNIAIFSEYGRC